MDETTYTSLREYSASIMDRVINDCEVVIVHPQRGQKVAMISADELAGLIMTAHLLRSLNLAAPAAGESQGPDSGGKSLDAPPASVNRYDGG